MTSQIPTFDPCYPGDVDVLEFDLTDMLATGSTIVGTPAFAAVPVGLTLAAPALSGNVALVWFSNPRANTRYIVTCEFTSSDGRRRSRSAYLPCIYI